MESVTLILLLPFTCRAALGQTPSFQFQDPETKEYISNPQCELTGLCYLSEVQNIKIRLLFKETQKLWKSKLLKKPRFSIFPQGRKRRGEEESSCWTFLLQPATNPGCLIWKLVGYEGSVTHRASSAWQNTGTTPRRMRSRELIPITKVISLVKC